MVTLYCNKKLFIQEKSNNQSVDTPAHKTTIFCGYILHEKKVRQENW